MDSHSANYTLLGVAQYWAPTGVEQEAFAQLKRDLDEAQVPPSEVTIVLAGALIDGLKHGNWPGR